MTDEPRPVRRPSARPIRTEHIAQRPSRLACLPDVHGNTAALDAVLASPEFADVDAVAFLGCTTTGPDPAGVLERCQALSLPTYYLAGNGERAVLELADGCGDASWEVGPWVLDRHGDHGVATIRSWPQALTCDVRGLGRVRMCHGSPRSDIELLTPATTPERIREATASIEERIVVHGHTHLQYERVVDGLRVIGPGSVGLPHTNGPFGARWAILSPEVELMVTPYPYTEAEARVLASGYPSDRFLAALKSPFTPDEVIADAESRHFSD